jgi:hypothetical protein
LNANFGVPGLILQSSDNYRVANAWELVRSDINDPPINLQPYVALIIEVTENPLDFLKSLIPEVMREEQARYIATLPWKLPEALPLEARKLLFRTGQERFPECRGQLV